MARCRRPSSVSNSRSRCWACFLVPSNGWSLVADHPADAIKGRFSNRAIDVNHVIIELKAAGERVNRNLGD